MKVVIIGAGIGGLVCAIACRRQNIGVIVLERAPTISPIGAGIQIPPNGVRVARKLGLLPELLKRSTILDAVEYRRYADGRSLYTIEGGEKIQERFGELWLVIHRADYLEVLWNAAQEAGVELRLDAEVDQVDFDQPSVRLVGGEVVRGDVVVGADGVWSKSRDILLNRPSPPTETGDLAYRGTFSLEQLEALNHPGVDDLIKRKVVTCWLGPDRHSVFYPVKGGKEFNLVLLRPDDLSHGVRQALGTVEEMRACFEGWDERLTSIISCMSSSLKWKLVHHEELESWTKGAVVLLGDACHPTLPYQAQGAAMATEDGGVLGKLLGLLSKSVPQERALRANIPKILQLYESLRKSRTTTIVQGAVSNKKWYHVPDGPLQEQRDALLSSPNKQTIANGPTLADNDYTREMLGFDAVNNSVTAFEKWLTAALADFA